MNRKQRRAEKKKSHDPAFVVKQSDMRSHIDRLLKNDPIVQQALQEEARRVNLEEAKKQDLDIMTLILYSLYRGEGYGKKRLIRVASTMNDLKKYYEGLFEELDMYAMRKHLREEAGVDVEKLDEEIEKYVKEHSTEG